MHNIRLLSALNKHRVQVWPYAGPISIRETDAIGAHTDINVIDQWCYLGTARSDDELQQLREHAGQPVFDADTYKLLSKHLKQLKPGELIEF